MNKTNLRLHQETKLGESTASVNKENENKGSNKEKGKHNANHRSELSRWLSNLNEQNDRSSNKRKVRGKKLSPNHSSAQTS